MKKKIGDLPLKKIVDMCTNECGDCELWDLCKALNWNIFTLAFEKYEILKEKVTVKDESK